MGEWEKDRHTEEGDFDSNGQRDLFVPEAAFVILSIIHSLVFKFATANVPIVISAFTSWQVMFHFSFLFDKLSSKSLKFI